MSEMDAPPKMEQFWNESSEHNGINLAIGGNHGHGGGSIISSTGSTGSGGSGHNQYERNLNFATGAIEDNEYGFPKKKTVRDPLSHRIIEKRRRDRMNNCLADLARLLPPSSLRKGRGRIEKTEIVELAIKHLRHLQCHPCTSGDKCEFNYIMKGSRGGGHPDQESNYLSIEPPNPQTPLGSTGPPTLTFPSTPEGNFRLGFHECMSEIMHFLIEEEGMYPGDSLCVRIIKHLRNHSESLIREQLKKEEEGKLGFLDIKKEEPSRKLCGDSSSNASDFNNGSSSSSGYQGNGSSSGSDGNGGQDTESPELFSIPGTSSTGGGTTNSEQPVGVDYDGENSCCSTQLSLDISDVYSTDGKNVGAKNNGSKPPIPAIICRTPSSSVTSPGESAVLDSGNGRSSSGDEGQGQGHDTGDGGSSASSVQYKFKNNIKQRFVADPENSKPQFVTKASLKEEQGPEKYIDADSSNSPEDPDPDVTMDEDGLSNIPEDRVRRHSTSGSNSRKIYLNEGCHSPRTGGKMGTFPPDTQEPNEMHSPAESEVMGYPEPKMNLKQVSSPRGIREHDNATGGESTIPLSFPLPKEAILGESLSETLSSSLLSLKNSDRVPAFALHDKGLYYIPLTIDKSMLSPYLAKIEEQTHLPQGPPPLHPVTISVCFLLSQGGDKGHGHGQGQPLFKRGHPSSPLLMPLPLPLIDNVNVTPSRSPLFPGEIPIGPLPLPLISPHTIPQFPLQGLNLKTPKPSPVKELGTKFALNRYSSKSRQYSPGPYRYPGTSTHHGQHNSHNLMTPSYQSHYPGYYSTDSSSNSTTSSTGTGSGPPIHQHPHTHPPSHLLNGEYSSSSSSSNSSSGRGLHGGSGGGRQGFRKRTMSAVSGGSGSAGSGSGSGSSSLGYHSFNEKYSPPNSQDSFPTGSSNSFSSQSHYNHHSSGGGGNGSYPYGQGQSQGHGGAGHHGGSGYHHSISGSGLRQHSSSAIGSGGLHHNMHFGYGMNLNLGGANLIPFPRDDKPEMERQRRSCSPNKSKRVKMGSRVHHGGVDDNLKQKPLPVGIPIIPIPSNE